MTLTRNPSASRHIMFSGENVLRAPTSEQMADWDELFREALLTSREELRFTTNLEAFLTVVSLLILGRQTWNGKGGALFSASGSQSAFSFGVSEGGLGTLQMGPGTEVVSALVHRKTCSGHWSPLCLPTGQARSTKR